VRPTSPTPSRGIPQVRRGISAERVRFYPMPTVRSGCASGDYAHEPPRLRGEEVCLPVGEVHVRPPVVVLALAGIPVGDPPGLEPERAFEAGYGQWQVGAHDWLRRACRVESSRVVCLHHQACLPSRVRRVASRFASVAVAHTCVLVEWFEWTMKSFMGDSGLVIVTSRGAPARRARPLPVHRGSPPGWLWVVGDALPQGGQSAWKVMR